MKALIILSLFFLGNKRYVSISVTSHDAILGMKKKLDSIEEVMKPVQNKLEAYKGLPPSLELATAELSEKEQVLDKLKSRLQNELQKIEL